jgi:hypothetical protein
MNINWVGFLTVAAVSITATVLVVALFSLGVRLLTTADNLVSATKKGNQRAISTEALSRTGSYVVFALCLAALLYGIYLVVPYFHLSS